MTHPLTVNNCIRCNRKLTTVTEVNICNQCQSEDLQKYDHDACKELLYFVYSNVRHDELCLVIAYRYRCNSIDKKQALSQYLRVAETAMQEYLDKQKPFFSYKTIAVTAMALFKHYAYHPRLEENRHV